MTVSKRKRVSTSSSLFILLISSGTESQAKAIGQQRVTQAAARTCVLTRIDERSYFPASETSMSNDDYASQEEQLATYMAQRIGAIQSRAPYGSRGEQKEIDSFSERRSGAKACKHAAIKILVRVMPNEKGPRRNIVECSIIETGGGAKSFRYIPKSYYDASLKAPQDPLGGVYTELAQIIAQIIDRLRRI